MNINDYYESSEERRNRRNRNIKAMYQRLTIDKKMPCMDAYEVTGYYFYLSAEIIRRILRTMNKSGHSAH